MIHNHKIIPCPKHLITTGRAPQLWPNVTCFRRNLSILGLNCSPHHDEKIMKRTCSLKLAVILPSYVGVLDQLEGCSKRKTLAWWAGAMASLNLDPSISHPAPCWSHHAPSIDIHLPESLVAWNPTEWLYQHRVSCRSLLHRRLGKCSSCTPPVRRVPISTLGSSYVKPYMEISWKERHQHHPKSIILNGKPIDFAPPPIQTKYVGYI